MIQLYKNNLARQPLRRKSWVLAPAGSLKTIITMAQTASLLYMQILG